MLCLDYENDNKTKANSFQAFLDLNSIHILYEDIVYV